MSRFLTIGFLVVVACAEPPPPQPAPEAPPIVEQEIPSVETMKQMLHHATKVCGFDRTEKAEVAVLALGERAFPAYELILADPKSDDRLLRRTFHFIARFQTDRRRFIPLVVRRLAPNTVANPELIRQTVVDQLRYFPAFEPALFLGIAVELGDAIADEHYRVRYEAAQLLGEIGDERDAEALRPLLTDNNGLVRYGAADGLARIGVKQDLDAMNAWLKADDRRKDANEQQHFTERRDELEARLKAHPIPKTLAN